MTTIFMVHPPLVNDWKRAGIGGSDSGARESVIRWRLDRKLWEHAILDVGMRPKAL
jgi:hypothetical protein